MENPEEVLQLLERFTKLKQKEIPRELDDYLGFVARTGDTVYRWAIVKHLFREKLVHVITDFHDNTPSIADLPQCPNVDPFNYERMKRILLERLDAFNSAPFTVQRICELLTEPRKQYTRIDKFMRAVEKNILVVSTQEPGRRRSDSENGDSLDSIVNGDLEVNVDIEMDNEAAAFGGIDAGAGAEIAPSSGTAATVPAEPSVAAAVSVQEEEPAAAAAVDAAAERSVAEPEVSKEDAAGVVGEEVADVVAATTESASAVDKEDEEKEQGLGDELATETPSTDDVPIEADLPKEEDSKPTEAESNEPTDDQRTIVPQPIEEPPSTTEDIPIPEENVQPLEPTTETTTSTEPPPSKESQDLATDQDLPDAAAIDSKALEPADDGQPAPKQAKLSEEVTEVPPVVAAAAPAPAIPESFEAEAEKDDASSGSTTDSGGSSSSSSNTSVESEPTPAVAAVQEEEPQPAAAVESLPEEPTTTAATTMAAAPVSSDEVTPAIVPVEPELIPEVKEEVPPVEEPVAGVEMETAVVVAPSAPVLIPESVMATDEEDTIIQSPVDAPMVADVPEGVKPDDNAMDVDESSVEPMEDQ